MEIAPPTLPVDTKPAAAPRNVSPHGVQSVRVDVLTGGPEIVLVHWSHRMLWTLAPPR